MQVNVIQGSSPALFNAMLFPEMNPETKVWLAQQWESSSGLLTDIGRRYASKAADLWKSIYDPQLYQKARGLMRQVEALFHPNTILYLDTIEKVQSASPIMQRYIMSMPEIRKIYHEQLCDGYSDSYIDNSPGIIGEAHYDYRRVMDSIVQYLPLVDGKEERWKATMYPDELTPGDRELEADEKFAILTAWDTARNAIVEKIDPTDIFNGRLEI